MSDPPKFRIGTLVGGAGTPAPTRPALLAGLGKLLAEHMATRATETKARILATVLELEASDYASALPARQQRISAKVDDLARRLFDFDAKDAKICLLWLLDDSVHGTNEEAALAFFSMLFPEEGSRIGVERLRELFAWRNDPRREGTRLGQVRAIYEGIDAFDEDALKKRYSRWRKHRR